MDRSAFTPYTIDCANCLGLCCVALYFSKAEGFPENKKPGVPCRHLQPDYKCNIHSQLSGHGLKGCMAYDCFGAGQHVTRFLSERPDWSSIPKEEANIIFNSYLTIMQIHQTLWYLTSASALRLKSQEKEQLRQMCEKGRKLTDQPLEILQTLDIEPFRKSSNNLLKQICTRIGNELNPHGKPDSVKNYMGKNLKRKNLIGKDFTSALLIAADLEGAGLFGANFLGADMRDANIKNTDLSQCLFLSQIQINAAKGNERTLLPPYLSRPSSWNCASK